MCVCVGGGGLWGVFFCGVLHPKLHLLYYVNVYMYVFMDIYSDIFLT